MSRTVEIKGKTYNGSVTIFDRFILPQVEAVEEALLDVPKREKNGVRYTNLDRPKLPALFACVEAWNISGFPDNLSPANFPLSPRRETHEMIEAIFGAIKAVYNGEQEIPNESGPTPT